MPPTDITELRRLWEAATKGQWVAMTAEYEAEDGIAWAQSDDCQRDADHAEYISACHNALPALLDELEAAQKELRRLTQANGDLRTGRDRAVKESQRQDGVAKGLRAELAAAKEENAKMRATIISAMVDVQHNLPGNGHAKLSLLLDRIAKEAANG